jgi:histidinol dehydrogenase
MKLSVTDHREREKGLIIYPVFSRRSKGLSIGINLFPSEKCCQFDCPYCEIFPFKSSAVFSLRQMETELRRVIEGVKNESIMDICFSGNGEPTLSNLFQKALNRAARLRDELAPNARLVLITNGGSLTDAKTFFLLKDAVNDKRALNIWLKVDAGTPEWHEKINRSWVSFDQLIPKIKSFISYAPVTLQTMLCSINGANPPEQEARSWEDLIVELAHSGKIIGVQIYGKARSAPEDPKTGQLPIEYLEERAATLRQVLQSEGYNSIPVEVFP